MRRAITAASLHRVVARYIEQFPDAAAERVRAGSPDAVARLLENMPPRVALALSNRLAADGLVAALDKCDERRVLQLAAELPAGRRTELAAACKRLGLGRLADHLAVPGAGSPAASK